MDSLRSILGLRSPIGNDRISIVGTGTEYPSYKLSTEILATIARKHFPPSSALDKSLLLSQNSGIESRYTVLDPEEYTKRREKLPTIADCDQLFKKHGIPLALEASKKAIACWGGSPSEITHIIAVTCTNTSSPGFDVAVCKQLELPKTVHRTLLHGVGCAGGVSALRTAYELLLGCSCRGRPGRALIIACEITSIFAWAELENLDRTREVCPGIALFGDCASAMVLSNRVDAKEREREPIWDVLNVRTELIEGSEGYLEYNIQPLGYIGTISKSIPEVIRRSLLTAFHDLVRGTFELAFDRNRQDPREYDWALHPGGYKIIQTAQDVLNLDDHHLRKSYEIYRSRGNTSSTTVLSVLDRFRIEMETSEEGREELIAVAFGPGMAIEMAVLERSTTR